MLEFQHIIQINDPAQLAIPNVAIPDLWEGLVFRTKCPGYFNPSLASKIEHISDTEFLRHLHFGDETLVDRVMLIEYESIHTSTETSGKSMFAESKIYIEEPAPGHMIIRFEYRRDSANVAGELAVDEYIKQAYVQNDVDAVRTLRDLIRTGIPSVDSWIQ